MIILDLDKKHQEVLQELIDERLDQKIDKEAELDRVREETSRRTLWEEMVFNYACSFCHKVIERKRLIVGPGVSICDECAESAVAILKEKKGGEQT